MRIYVPDRNEGILTAALKELYMLQQAIDHKTGTVSSRVNMASAIRDKLKELLSKVSAENEQ
tara:strand:+ start:1362 stop:1547 length:186 start_codon:yes stop_codon:yes gene_type:complete